MAKKKPSTVQDDSREIQLAALCGLEHLPGRAGPDAQDEFGNPYELKSTTRTGVSTARDVGLHTIAEWRSKYWLFAVGINYESGFEIEALYIAHPDVLEPRFAEIEQQIMANYAPCAVVLEAAKSAGVAAELLDAAQRVIDRGVTLNNPKIPIHLVEENAKQLNHAHQEKASAQLRQYIKQNPLIVS